MEFNDTSNFTASGNTIHDNASLGLHVYKSATGTISNNIIYHNQHNGIDLHGDTYVTIQGNQSYLNGGPRTTGAEGQGILVYSSQHVDVLSNTVWNNSQYQPGKRNGIGVSDNGGAGGEMPTKHVTVDGNTSYDNQATATQGYAVMLGGPGDLNYITVTNNHGWGNVHAGLGTKGLAPGATVTISNNTLTGH